MSQAISSIDGQKQSLRSTAAVADWPDVPTILVSDASPNATQNNVAWGIVALLSIAFALAIPVYHVNLAIVPAFVPVVHAVVFVTSLIAAAFLFSQYAVQPQSAFLALASGYLGAGLFAFFQSLAFPNAYSATGIFGDDPSVAAWLFLSWRTSLPLGILVYALTPRLPPTKVRNRAVAAPIAITIVSVAIGVCFLTWIITIAEPHLPQLFTDATHEAPKAHYTTVPAVIISLAAIFLLLTRRRTMLDLWLIVTLVAALPDIVVPVSRFALGFYLARSYELISSCAVLMALLTEASTLYARFANAKILQAQGEKDRLATAEVATAAIAHELRQPLCAIGIHAHAGIVHLLDQNPDLSVVREILTDIGKDTCRANDVIDRIRGVVRRQTVSVAPLDINTLVSDVAKLVSHDAAARRVIVVTDLASECPQVAADRTQITQVLLNLIVNGMDAMEGMPTTHRRLALHTEKRDDAVAITVSDNGCGISPEIMSRLFDPFFTTRSGGMGLGLSIAHSIVERHNGSMWAESNPDGGATFSFSLPALLNESAGPNERTDGA